VPVNAVAGVVLPDGQRSELGSGEHQFSRRNPFELTGPISSRIRIRGRKGRAHGLLEQRVTHITLVPPQPCAFQRVEPIGPCAGERTGVRLTTEKKDLG
jgi:hypothetical protein